LVTSAVAARRLFDFFADNATGQFQILTKKIFTKPFFFLCFTNNTLYYSFPDFIFGGCLWIYGRIQSDNLTKESFLRRLLRSIAGAKGFANCKGNDNAKSQNH
jgi:hypothetical protein